MSKNVKMLIEKNVFKVFALTAVAAVLIVAALFQSGAIADDSNAVSIDSATVEMETFSDAVDVSEQNQQEQMEVFQEPVTSKIQFINFEADMSLRKALKMLQVKYRRNIIPSPNVDGAVTTGVLYDVTFEEAMNAILGYQFRWDDDGKFIWVYTADEYEKIKYVESRMISKAFTLYYINAKDAEKLIESALSNKGKVSSASAAQTDTEPGKSGDQFAMRDTIIVRDFPENIDKVAEMLREIDIRPPQILIEATVIRAVLDDNTKFGIDWSSLANVGAATAGSTEISSTGFANSVLPASGLNVGISLGDIAGFLRALEVSTNTTVLANPKILALNKQAGRIQIGSKEGYLNTTSITDGGTQTQQVEFLDTGTILEFRPYICDNGYIRMELRPEESSGSVEPLGNQNLPNKTITAVQTNIMVKDGKTIVIGGLFKDDIVATQSQVPVLGDIPFIGSLFKSTSEQTIKTELIVLITPHIIYEPEDTGSEKITEQINRIQHGANKRLTWLSRSRLADDAYARAVDCYVKGNKQEALSKLDYLLFNHPDYDDARKLREQIIKETSPDQYQMIERIMLDKMKNES